jgi:hypothetical protein
MMNMTREETLNTRWGEFQDMLSCKAIESGSVKQKPPKKHWSIFEVLNLR